MRCSAVPNSALPKRQSVRHRGFNICQIHGHIHKHRHYPTHNHPPVFESQVLYALDAKVDSVLSMTGEARGGGGGEVWWESLSQRPPIKYVMSAYQQAHDVVVATPIYTKCVNIKLVGASRVRISGFRVSYQQAHDVVVATPIYTKCVIMRQSTSAFDSAPALHLRERLGRLSVGVKPGWTVRRQAPRGMAPLCG